MSTNRSSIGRTSTRILAAAFTLTAGLVAVGTQPASAAVLVPVPAGCGAHSGTLVLASTIDDHTNDATRLGSNAAPHQVPAGIVYTVGTQFGDYIVGTSAADVICGLDKGDEIAGGLGDDELFGGNGADSLFGDGGADLLSGAIGRDELYGNNPLNTSANFDRADVLQGGEGDDELFGGAFGDTLTGGPGSDFGDGEAALTDTCLAIEVEVSCEL